jgi:hypothetical protein
MLSTITASLIFSLTGIAFKQNDLRLVFSTSSIHKIIQVGQACKVFPPYMGAIIKC